MVFYTNPVAWWFGSGLLTSITNRWTLLSVVFLAFCLLINGRLRTSPHERGLRRFFWVSIFLIVNICCVHYLLAADEFMSGQVFREYWRGLLGALLLIFAVRDRKELEIFLAGVAAFSFLAGFEIIVGGQGGMERGRLEGFQFPGAQGSNGGSVVLLTGLPLISFFVLQPKYLWMFFGSVCSAVFTLETIFRCNSRGAYVGLVAAGCVVLLVSKGAVRRKAILLTLLGSIGILAMAKNERIWERFYSIFAESEQRDEAADSRLYFWAAAVEMISDYPLGSGGKGAFYSARGHAYIRDRYSDFRSVHNGPLDMAAAWGVQGISAFLFLYSSSAIALYRKSKQLADFGRERDSFMGICILGSLGGAFVASCFTSVLDGEWFMWVAGLGACYGDLGMENENTLDHDDEENVVDNTDLEEECITNVGKFQDVTV
jgi:hypothetical protein